MFERDGRARHLRGAGPRGAGTRLEALPDLLATKLRGSGLESYVEVVARIDAEHEKRLVPVFTRI